MLLCIAFDVGNNSFFEISFGPKEIFELVTFQFILKVFVKIPKLEVYLLFDAT